MKLHIFNPEHDMALAMNNANFTAPHAACSLRHDIGFIPSLWADDGDIVVVDDVETAQNALRHVKKRAAKVEFICATELHKLHSVIPYITSIEPWGWDCVVKKMFLRADSAFEPLLPTDDQLSKIRFLSSRKFSADYLRTPLCQANKRYIGSGKAVNDIEEISSILHDGRRWVLKSPWSCSGRGVRYVEKQLSEHEKGWCRNILSTQGYIMIEPYFEKVIDFGMEFNIKTDGQINYEGLSVFATRNGAYTGNVLATEKAKRDIMSKYIDTSLLDDLQNSIKRIMQPHVAGIYAGVFGVDMMVVCDVANNQFLIHPCIEMNLRRTMGHVAISISGDESTPQAMMFIDFDGKHHFRIRPTNENIVNTSLFA